MGNRLRIVAVDWSGRIEGEQRAIWLAEAIVDSDGDASRITRLECGRSREEVADHLVALAEADPDLAVGFDFSFSLPDWFLDDRGFVTADDLWAEASHEGDRWLAECAPPFWGRAGHPRPELPCHFRATEAQLPATGGIRPKSTFQIGGAGSVGTGSIRGFPVLARLRAEGFRIWPFHDEPIRPVVAEIYPRLFTGDVVKSRAAARGAYLAEQMREVDDEMRSDATTSEDAFDAVVSVHAMARHAGALASLPVIHDPRARREGRVWVPEPSLGA